MKIVVKKFMQPGFKTSGFQPGPGRVRGRAEIHLVKDDASSVMLQEFDQYDGPMAGTLQRESTFLVSVQEYVDGIAAFLELPVEEENYRSQPKLEWLRV